MDLLGIAHHQAKMLDAVGLQVIHFENRHELMFSQLAPGRPLTASQHFESEDVRVKPDGLFGIGDLNDDVVATIHLYGHD
jgi:hypothetical protein